MPCGGVAKDLPPQGGVGGGGYVHPASPLQMFLFSTLENRRPTCPGSPDGGGDGCGALEHGGCTEELFSPASSGGDVRLC